MLAGVSFGQAPSITEPPASQTVFHGDPAVFRVTATGTPPLSYQWYRDGALIPAATGSTHTLPAVAGGDHQAGFSVRVANAIHAVTSATAVLTVDFGVPGSPVTNRVLDYDGVWTYNQSNNLDGVDWTGPGYDDSGWPSGPGLLASENNSAITPLIRTTLLPPNEPPPGLTAGRAYYFRTTAVLTNDFIQSGLLATVRLDDGAVLYLNGAEMTRIRMPTGTITNRSRATAFPPGGSSDATTDEPFPLVGLSLPPGTNRVAISVHQQNTGSSDIVWAMALDVLGYQRLRDTLPPAVESLVPVEGTTVPTLTQIEVHFSESVRGVEAGDLLINGTAATNVTAFAPDVYIFEFRQPATGQVQVAWSPTHGIADLSAGANPFAGGDHAYVLDPMVFARDVFITEFMAGNNDTIRDEDGQYSDWTELYNDGDDAVALGGWYLTDQSDDLTKWRFPDGVTLASKSYLLVWASGNNRTQPAAPLHTSFKLSKAGGNYLALVLPDGESIVSSFTYPPQYDDVSYGRDRMLTSVTGYFTNATPGAANATLGAGFGSDVYFSRTSGTFQQTFNLTLGTDTSNAVIRYFLVTNAATAAMTGVPNAGSPVYTAPLSIGTNVQVRARVFPAATNYFPGPPRSETYLRITAGAAAFSSDVPIVLFHNFGAGTPPASMDQSAVMMIFDASDGRATLTHPPDVCARIGINIRGRSTEGMAKKSFAVEAWDEFNEDRAIGVLGMPEESDWVFYAPNYFDKPLIHNPVIHALSRSIGRYSSRTRMAEVFTSFGTGSIHYSSPGVGNYNGIYVVEEKIKADGSRVDVPRLQPEETNAPAVTGGYMLKIDSADADERTVYAATKTMVYVEPPMEDYATYAGRATQETYIQGYFNSFYATLYGANWTNPVTGYAAWIDVDSWVDHHILNTLSLNADALRLSGYFFKDRDRKLEMGPLWDFDRSMGTSAGADWRPWNPRSWTASNPLGNAGGSDYGTDYFNSSAVFDNPWYSRLCRDPDFWQKWIDRYQDLRGDELSTNAVLGLVDRLADELREAQPREVAKWPESTPRSGQVVPSSDWPDTSYVHVFPGTYQGEIDFLKRWLTDRLTFIDTNFLARPTFSLAGGPVAGGQTLTLTPAAKAGTYVIYTLDGSDPRLPGGAVSPSAFSSNGAVTITVTTNVRVVARSWNSTHQNLTGTRNPPISSRWSGRSVDTFYTVTPPLRVTELMYHPSPPPAGNTNDTDNFEYIELQNISGAPLRLGGFRPGGGIELVFPDLTLPAGQRVVVVRHLAAFQARYGTGALIAGIYTNRLGDAGDRVILEGPLAEPILDFEYRDDWYPATDGLGASLVIRDANAVPGSWGLKPSWRPSTAIGGSPGQAEAPPPAIAGLLITEALAHTDPPQVDTVEIHNPTAEPVDAGGWLLTDDPDEPAKYLIPAGTIIAPGGYRTLAADPSDAGAGFALSATGDEVYLFSADAQTNLSGYGHGFVFGASPNGVSFGRFLNSFGDEHFVLQSRNSLGAGNAYPNVGPVVISEIMYHPPDLPYDLDNVLDEFIELLNIAPTNVPLYDPTAPTNTWRLRNAVDFDFPTNLVLAPGERLLVVGFDPDVYTDTRAAFTALYSVPGHVRLLGPFDGKMDNSGENLELERPDHPNVTPTNSVTPYCLAERVSFRDMSPWPATADGGGSSLQRIFPTLFGDDATHWQAAAPTAGQGNAVELGPEVDSDGDGATDVEETIAGTDRLDRDSHLRLVTPVSVVPSGDAGFVVSWLSESSRFYRVEISTNLAGGLFDTLAGGLPATPPVNSYADTNAPAVRTRFYRVGVE